MARLCSQVRRKGRQDGTGWAWLREHARVGFSADPARIAPPPLDLVASLEGPCRRIPAETIYAGLVPFGPAYRNLQGTLLLSGDGALARIGGGMDTGDSPSCGSPFPLDAALHAACVWGQHFQGATLFPVAFGRRWIQEPTAPGERYVARVFFTGKRGKASVFDLWIYGEDGSWREAALGVEMQDRGAGEVRPAAPWEPPAAPLLDPLRSRCAGLAIVELEGVAPFASQALSAAEEARFAGLGERRRSSFLAARLASKRLVRRLAGGDRETPAQLLTTIGPPPRDQHPRCPLPDGREPWTCSVSHDRRFAVAAAGNGRIGVDVEPLSERVLKGLRLFMRPQEIARAEASPLGLPAAALRVWSVKEALSKALDLPLADAWERVSVTAIGPDASFFRVGPLAGEALHAPLEDHVLTVVSVPAAPHPFSS